MQKEIYTKEENEQWEQEALAFYEKLKNEGRDVSLETEENLMSQKRERQLQDIADLKSGKFKQEDFLLFKQEYFDNCEELDILAIADKHQG